MYPLFTMTCSSSWGFQKTDFPSCTWRCQGIVCKANVLPVTHSPPALLSAIPCSLAFLAVLQIVKLPAWQNVISLHSEKAEKIWTVPKIPDLGILNGAMRSSETCCFIEVFGLLFLYSKIPKRLPSQSLDSAKTVRDSLRKQQSSEKNEGYRRTQSEFGPVCQLKTTLATWCTSASRAQKRKQPTQTSPANFNSSLTITTAVTFT